MIKLKHVAIALFSIFSSLNCSLSHSMDLGVMGDVWSIAEPDVRKIIMKDLMKVNWDKQNALLKKDAKSFISRLPKRNLEYAPTKTSAWIDVSVELNQDIQAPVKNSLGGYSWQTIAKKGDRYNPLKSKKLVQLIYFFNGADEEQVAILKSLLEKEPLLIMPVEAGAGDLNKTSKELDRPIFYAQEYMINQFKVSYLPTIAFQGAGDRSEFIRTISYPSGTSAKTMLEDWDSSPRKQVKEVTASPSAASAPGSSSISKLEK